MRPAKHNIIVHSPRRLFWRPWRKVCRCGMGPWPCYAVLMRQRQAAMQPPEDTRVWVGRSPVMPRRDSPLLTPGQVARSRQGGGRR